MQKVKCPFCGYEMPIFFDERSLAVGIKVKCKGRNCGIDFPLCIGMESNDLKKQGIESDQFKIKRKIK